MKECDQLLKSSKKAARYIQQEAPEEKLLQIKKVIDAALNSREKQIRRKGGDDHGNIS